MDISLNINYTVTVSDISELYDTETHALYPDVKERLSMLFPERITISDSISGERGGLSHIPLSEGKNAVKCICCGRWLSLRGKEYLTKGLDVCEMFEGKCFCSNCFHGLTEDEKRDM